jgi:5-(carboxyamino)imidazole ribonucleotide synthase
MQVKVLLCVMNRQTIGIVGGGQLGRMLTQAAQPLGFSVVVIDPGENSPATQVGATQIEADLYDKAALSKLADQSDYITVEIEHLDADALAELVKEGSVVNPAPSTIKLIQDKYLQKEFLRKAGLDVADFVKIDNYADAQKALKKFGGSMVLKTRHGAYDGRGNAVITNEIELKQAWELFKDTPLYAEELIPFTKELAVMVARSTKGEIAIYPVVETVQERNICLEVLAPAAVGKTTTAKAVKLATKTAELLEGAGVFGIEMFLTKGGKVLINEIAPRVHNSGHYTIEACVTSQFEQHIRAISGLPLGDTSLRAPAAVMINILGERNGDTFLTGLDKAEANPHTKVHIYGKSPTKIDRKMGHITSLGETVDEARQRARQARRSITI